MNVKLKWNVNIFYRCKEYFYSNWYYFVKINVIFNFLIKLCFSFQTLGSSSNDFDITLMICILRNFNLVQAPSSGWDILPQSSDNSLGANLARIKYYRNYVSHSSDFETDVNTFRDYWATLKRVSLT